MSETPGGKKNKKRKAIVGGFGGLGVIKPGVEMRSLRVNLLRQAEQADRIYTRLQEVVKGKDLTAEQQGLCKAIEEVFVTIRGAKVDVDGVMDSGSGDEQAALDLFSEALGNFYGKIQSAEFSSFRNEIYRDLQPLAPEIVEGYEFDPGVLSQSIEKFEAALAELSLQTGSLEQVRSSNPEAYTEVTNVINQFKRIGNSPIERDEALRKNQNQRMSVLVGKLLKRADHFLEDLTNSVKAIPVEVEVEAVVEDVDQFSEIKKEVIELRDQTARELDRLPESGEVARLQPNTFKRIQAAFAALDAVTDQLVTIFEQETEYIATPEKRKAFEATVAGRVGLYKANALKLSKEIEVFFTTEASKTTKVAEAKNFDELYAVITELGTFVSTKKGIYTAEQLKGNIDRVRHGRGLRQVITKVYGIREAVERLLEAEKLQVGQNGVGVTPLEEGVDSEKIQDYFSSVADWSAGRKEAVDALYDNFHELVPRGKTPADLDPLLSSLLYENIKKFDDQYAGILEMLKVPSLETSDSLEVAIDEYEKISDEVEQTIRKLVRKVLTPRSVTPPDQLATPAVDADPLAAVIAATPNAKPVATTNGESWRIQVWPDPREEMAVIQNSEELEGLNHYDISDLVPGKILEMTTASGNVYRLSIRTENDGAVHTYLYNERQGTEVRADRLPAQVTLGKGFFATQLNDDGTITRTDSSVLAKIQIVDEVAAPNAEPAATINGEEMANMSASEGLGVNARINNIGAGEPISQQDKVVVQPAPLAPSPPLPPTPPPPLAPPPLRPAPLAPLPLRSAPPAPTFFRPGLHTDVVAALLADNNPAKIATKRAEQFTQKHEAKNAFKVAEAAYYAEARKHADAQAKLGVWANYWGKEAKPSAEYLAAEQALNVATNNRRQLTYERTDAMKGANDTALVWSKERIDRGMASVMFVERRKNLQKIKEEALAHYRESDTFVNSALRIKDVFMGKLSKAIRNENGEINNNTVVGLVGLGATAVGLAITTAPVWAAGTLIGAGTGFMVRSGAKALGNSVFVKPKEEGIKKSEAETIAQIRSIDIAEQIKALTAEHKKLDASKRRVNLAANATGSLVGLGTLGWRTGVAEQLYNGAVDALSPTPLPEAVGPRPAAPMDPAVTQALREDNLRALAEERENRELFGDRVVGQPQTPRPEPTPQPPTPRPEGIPPAAPPDAPRPAPPGRLDVISTTPIQATMRSGDRLWTMVDRLYREGVPQNGVSAERFRALPPATRDRLLNEVFTEMRGNSSLREAIGIGANGVETRLPVGQRVDLRPLSQLMEQKINALTAAPGPVPEGVVVVQPNNTLWGIARSRFSDEFSGVSDARRNQVLSRLREAINTNAELRNSIGITSGDADRIYEGQQLNLTRVREFIRKELELTQVAMPSQTVTLTEARTRGLNMQLPEPLRDGLAEQRTTIADINPAGIVNADSRGVPPNPTRLNPALGEMKVVDAGTKTEVVPISVRQAVLSDIANGEIATTPMAARAVAMGAGAAATAFTPTSATRERVPAPRQSLPAIEPGSVETTEFIEAAARQFGGSQGFTEAVAKYIESVEPRPFLQAIFGGAENPTYGKISQMTIGKLAETSLLEQPEKEEFLLNNGITSNSFQIWAREVADVEMAIEGTGKDVPPEITVAELMSYYALIRPDLFKKA